MKFIALAGFLLLVQLTQAQKEIEVSEIAPYEILEEGDGFEMRKYAPAKWVCHSLVQKRISDRAQRLSFFSLFRYIDGGNVGENEIPMTAPVSMRKTPLGELTESQMCFYIPAAHQENPPTPNDDTVYIEERPAFVAYTRRFGGFANRNSVWEAEAAKLKDSLEAAGKTNVDFSYYYRAGYDSPMKFTDRRNEIWYLLKD